jgi:hypothetical protein
MGDNDTLKKQYTRALRQIVDTVAPAMNPRRRKEKLDKAEAEANPPDHFDRQTTDSNN